MSKVANPVLPTMKKVNISFGNEGSMVGTEIKVGNSGMNPVGVQLFEFQANTVASIVNALRQGTITLGDKTDVSRLIINSVKLQAKLGTGKTRMYLCVIYLMLNGEKTRKMPTFVLNVPVMPEKSGSEPAAIHLISKVYERVLNVAFIFVTKAVFWQTVNENKFCGLNLRMFLVEKAADFLELKHMIQNNTLGGYDAVLFNTISTAKYAQHTHPGCEYSVTALNVVLAENSVVPLVAVYDDYDTGMRGQGSPTIPARYNIYVSATKGADGGRDASSPSLIRYNYSDLRTPILMANGSIEEVVRDNSVIPTVDIDENKIQRETNLPSLGYIKVTIRNRNDALFALARIVDPLHYAKYIELLNGGAVKEAAKFLSQSEEEDPREILMKSFHEHHRIVERSNRIIYAVEKMTKGVNTAKRWAENERNQKHGDAAEVIIAIKKYGDTGNASYVRDVNAQVMELSTTSSSGLHHLFAEATAQKNAHIASINQMNSNFTNAVKAPCPGCGGTQGERRPTWLMMCCTTVVCASCLFRGNGENAGSGAVLQLVNNGKGNVRKCGRCGKMDSIGRPLQYVEIADANDEMIKIDLNKWFEAASKARAAAPPKVKRVKSRCGPKHDVLISICRDEEIRVEGKVMKVVRSNGESISAEYKAVMKGGEFKQRPAGVKPTVIVVAASNETIMNAHLALNEAGISNRHLCGSAGDVETAVNAHRNGEFDVLLLSSITGCQGLNLQYASHMVFMHHIINSTQSAQFAGRLQRIGRPDYSGVIIEILFQNEEGI